jgi:glycolate oxidase iron-sulfur subunit
MTASGCGVHVKDYGHLLRDDPAYAGKAARVAALTRDLGEILIHEDLAVLRRSVRPGQRIVFQAPCTLQHGQKLSGVVEGLLHTLGFTLVAAAEPNLCCGSAGTYSMLQHDLSQQLLRRKLGNLEAGRPELIATSNIGCLAHLASQATVPVRHWIELL